VEAATFSVNPGTAYRMLHDYVNLKAGDTVIQNGANSAVGQNVIQMCKARGISTVNIVRKRDNIADLKKFLTDLGASYVLTEEELRYIFL
jgi:trans-2-enoyl-CoA reductase